jgi:hypothetical protein
VTPWTADNPPTVDEVREHLRKFIVDEMSRCLTGAHKHTVEEWFDSLLASKRVLLVLDAFDEISALLDADSVETDTSAGGGNRKQQTELLRAITQGVESYFQLAGCRGIVAARPYCAPVWKSGVRLRIRPMSELRIAQLLRKASLPESAIRDFFSHHGDLVSLSRNPFLANLLVEYLAQDDRATRGQFPANQAELYRDFFKARLVPRILRAAPKGRGNADPITAEDVETTTCAVADTMFEQALLELPEDHFPAGLQTPKSRSVLSALCAGRFLRRGQDDNRLLSFAHRRFAEFFALEARLKRREHFSASLLAERSRWSEALILYCGIAEPADAERLARECWEPIRSYRDAGPDVTAERMRGAKAYLRILADAFCNRREVLGDLRAELGQFVQGCLARPRVKGRKREAPQFLNVEMAEAALGAVILCPDDEVGTIAQHAFDWDNEALTEVALRQCRYLPRSNRRLEFKLFNYISRRSPREILRGRRETSFALNLSESTRAVYWYHRMRVWESRGFFALHALAIGLVLFGLIWAMSSRLVTHDASPVSSELSLATAIWWILGTCSVWALLWVIFYHCCAIVASVFVGFRSYNRLDLVRTAPNAFAAFFCIWEFFVVKFGTLDRGAQAMALGTFAFFLLSFPWTFPWIFYRLLRFSGQTTQAFLVSVAKLWPLWAYGLLAYVYWRFLSDYSLELSGWALGHVSEDMVASHRERLPAFILGVAIPAVALLAYPPFFRKAKRWLLGLIHDGRASRACTINAAMRREQIAHDFLSLQTGWGRMRYVRKLGKKCKSASGDWPHGVMPYIDRDRGSKRLHLLDRSWQDQD